MSVLYRLFLEKLSRDIAVSAAVGVTAGMRAAINDGTEGRSIDSRIEAELEAVLDELRKPSAMIAAPVPAIESGTPLKRGPGRPRKNPLPEAQS